MVFGHHIVITSIDSEISDPDNGEPRVRISFVDSSGGRVGTGFLSVAKEEFTAPTFTYDLREGRASQTEEVRTGRPLLEICSLSYESPGAARNRIVTAHFATFAETGD